MDWLISGSLLAIQIQTEKAVFTLGFAEENLDVRQRHAGEVEREGATHEAGERQRKQVMIKPLSGRVNKQQIQQAIQ